MKSFFSNNGIEMFPTYNVGKSVIAERLIGSKNNKNYKYMMSVSKNANNDKLDDIVNKFDNIYIIAQLK